ncbi:MAG: hypothetical protein VKK32_05050 [Candidatus Melainabacteria bacterium]|nr:hypothetical protein [Candidatus Melainabacteria bacterium]
MISSGVNGGDGPSSTGDNLITVDFTTNKPRSERVTNERPTHNSPSSRADVQYLSQFNDPFTELATRLTDFFSKPESENHQAQEIKNACWNDLTDDKRPVFEPNFGNLRDAQFSKSPEGLTITLSQDHVEQGYLQVLSDLTLVAEVIKRSISKEAEDPIGFTANPIENIKIISHPKRNTEISVKEMIKNEPYEVGPEFKFVNSRKDGVIPVANGMFNLGDVQAGKLRTPHKNNHELEVLAFKNTPDPILEMFAINKPLLTARNTIYLASPANPDSYEHEAIMDAFDYQTPRAELINILSNYNNDGKVFYATTHNPPKRGSLETSHVDPNSATILRNMLDYSQDANNPERYHPNTLDMLRHRDLDPLARIDALTLLTQGTYPQHPNGGLLTTQYTLEHRDMGKLREIHAKHQKAANKR